MRARGGFVTVEHVAIAAFGLVLFTWAVNLVLLQYARSVTRLALDEGVRNGAVVTEDDPVARCADAASAALGDLAGGTLGAGIVVSCTADGESVRARATGAVTSWVPGVVRWRVDESAIATRISP